MFSWYKYEIVNLVFPTSVIGVGIFFWLSLFLIVAYLYILTFTSRVEVCNMIADSSKSNKSRRRWG